MTGEMDREDSEHHSFYYFHRSLLQLSLPAEEASNNNGNHNTAWELRDEIAKHPISYFANSPFLSISPAQLNAIEVFAKVVADIPDEVVSPRGIDTGTVEGDIASLKQSALDPIRAHAAEVIKILEPVAIRNKAYFDNPRS